MKKFIAPSLTEIHREPSPEFKAELSKTLESFAEKGPKAQTDSILGLPSVSVDKGTLQPDGQSYPTPTLSPLDKQLLAELEQYRSGKYKGYELHVSLSIEHNEGDDEGVSPDWRLDFCRTFFDGQAVINSILGPHSDPPATATPTK